MKKTLALAREFLNDWEAVWIVVAHPSLPLTHNDAERALRHGVIARLLSQGTRTEQGSRAFAWLASVIDTCPPTPPSALALLGQGRRRAAQRQPGAPATGCRLI